MNVRLAYLNILARDIAALSGFYARLFGYREIESHRSPIYRCLDAGGIEFGFNADKAYDLLDIADRKPEARGSVQVYFTFEVSSPDAVGALAQACAAAGGRIVKPPYDTYYNARQAVLEDPEGNVFRRTAATARGCRPIRWKTRPGANSRQNPARLDSKPPHRLFDRRPWPSLTEIAAPPLRAPSQAAARSLLFITSGPGSPGGETAERWRIAR